MNAVQADATQLEFLKARGQEVVIPLRKLKVDHTYQRPLRDRRVKDMSGEHFNADLVGRLTVSRRQDGSLFVVEGQHRLAAMLASGITEWPCIVHEGWSLADEAFIYTKRGSTPLKQSAYESHLSSLAYGDPIALDIEAIVKEIGGTLAPRNHPDTGLVHHISCVDTLRRIYGLKNEHGRYPTGRYAKQNGREHLRRTLGIIVDAWSGMPCWSDKNDKAKPFHADIVKAVAIFLWFAESDPNFDEQKLIQALGRITPGGLLTSATAFNPTTPPTAIANAIRKQYNLVIRKGKLSEAWVFGDLPK